MEKTFKNPDLHVKTFKKAKLCSADQHEPGDKLLNGLQK